ncbi:MAG TPA: phenylalanine--tRNA ligase subunit beta [Candidatus Paceibacterota bacterium]|nr:phenylalanine--tRNA ligase subunit beta [Candidatus Paceibacterota bacterium]
MKFSYNWLKDLLKFKESPEKLADILTMYFAEATVKYYGKRPVLDVELLSNQVAEASGHLGLARETGAILGKIFIYPKINLKEKNLAAKDLLDIKIKSSNCNCYLARVIQGIKIKESPKWLEDALADCGVRSINNIVDAANYVMLETGQPLHTFDFDKICSKSTDINKKEIIIRQAKKNEKITTLEDEVYDLNEDIMVIADNESSLSLAGIKGGKKSGISTNTTNIILESANFNGVNIRSSSKKLGLRTDASWRFEHNLPLDLTGYAVDRLAQLIQEVAGGNILKGKVGQGIFKEKKELIPIKWENWEKFLGWSIKKKEIIYYLSLLGFSLQQKKDYILVSPPCFRNDVKIKEDVMGEVARLYGIDKVDSVMPQEVLTIPLHNEFFEFRKQVKDWLKGYNLEEVYNYSFISEQDKNILPNEWQQKLIEIENPTSALTKYLRPTLLVNFLKNINYNFRFVDKIRFFEIGKSYFKDKKNLKEFFVLSGTLAQKEKSNNLSILLYEAKGIIEDLFNKFGIDKDNYGFKSLENTEYSLLLEQGTAIYKNKDLIGVIGNPKKGLLKEYDCEGSSVFWEIKLLPLLEIVKEEREFQPLPKYPAIIRDISFIISQNILVDKILNVIQEASPLNLEDVDLFDVYIGKNLKSGTKSLSFHLTFRSKGHTLKNEEVDKEMEKVYKGLKNIGAEIR